MSALPPVGSAELLERLSPHVPDQFVADLIPRRKGCGRRADFSSAQLFRTLLLSVLTPMRSFDLLPDGLSQNRSWRRFASLSRQRQVPGPRILHEFRQKLSPLMLRAINAHLPMPLLDQLDPRTTVALIDATDLPAATNPYKKTARENIQPIAPPWVAAA
jgi:hypothetical protein